MGTQSPDETNRDPAHPTSGNPSSVTNGTCNTDRDNNSTSDLDSTLLEIVAERASWSSLAAHDVLENCTGEHQKTFEAATNGVVDLEASLAEVVEASGNQKSSRGKSEKDVDLMDIVAERATRAPTKGGRSEVDGDKGEGDLSKTNTLTIRAAREDCALQPPSQDAQLPAEEVQPIQEPMEQESAVSVGFDLLTQPGAYHVTPTEASASRSQPNEVSQPGATNRVLPGATSQRTDLASDGLQFYCSEEDSLDYDEDEESNPQGPPTGSVHQLVEANPVVDTCNSATASPVDLEAARQKRESWKRQNLKFCGMLVFLCISATVTVTAVVAKRSNKSTTLVALPGTGTSEAENDIEELATSSPTWLLPPLGNLQPLYDDLPDKTKKSLAGTGTPQRKAWDWLLGHRNITNLEHWRKKQIFAMATFFYAFDGPSWPENMRINWLDETKEECSWPRPFYYDSKNDYYDSRLLLKRALRYDYDFSPCNNAGELKTLDMGYDDKHMNLTEPFIPPEIGFLTSLTYLSIGSGSGHHAPLDQILVQEVAQLPKLEFFIVFNNELVGTIPKHASLMTELKIMAMGANHLTGTIPDLSALTNLQSLSLGRNPLSGTIPNNLGLLTSLTDLVLRDTLLTGKIPSELGLLTDIFRFNLMSNSLSGSIPSELGMMANTTWLFLQNTMLSGSIPSELWQLSQIKSLDFSNLPLLTGSVPDSFCYLQQKDEACSFPYYKDDSMEVLLPCKLKFDCTELLCGCDCGC